MNTFVKTLEKKNKKPLKTLTENGAVTFSTSTNKNVDLFFKIGALRGQPESKIISIFKEAFDENQNLAVRILLWARDVRSGAGERQIFKTVFNHIEMKDQDLFKRIANKVGELGRWDDLLVAKTSNGQDYVFSLIKNALAAGNGLCAKWMPRKGDLSIKLRNYLGLSPKRYRKTLVDLTKVVETQMCNKEFGAIEYKKVPSLAMSRYTKAFRKRDEERFNQYLVDVTSGKTTINAGAVYPYDVLKGLPQHNWGYNYVSETDRARMIAQWDALPNYLSDQSILPMVDVSGSMSSNCGGNLTCMQVATSLGLYLATKNTGPFKDVLMTFTDSPSIMKVRGNIVEKHLSLFNHVGYSTNLRKAFEALLTHAVTNNVPQKDMPKYILILSDMEFDAFNPGETAHKNIKMQYKNAGYDAPVIVWWNIQSRSDNSPVKADKNGNVLVSGFSPAIAKSILSMDTKSMNPLNAMLEVILKPRYDF